MKLKSLFKGILDEKDIEIMPSSFDMIGDICLFNDFPEELREKENLIGEKIIKEFKNMNVVGIKEKEYSGVYRIPKIRIIAGENRTETSYKEHGVRLLLDVEKTYFSVRTSTERKRIFNQVKKDETILVMFSGVAPLPITISKNSKAKEIYGIEINETAHEYAVRNLEINKVNNVKLYNGDVREVLPKINKKFDRILMPLPRHAEEFIPLALQYVKKRGIIHFYSFLNIEEIEDTKKRIIERGKEQNKNIKFKDVVRCGQFSPGVFRICFDILAN